VWPRPCPFARGKIAPPARTDRKDLHAARASPRAQLLLLAAAEVALILLGLKPLGRGTGDRAPPGFNRSIAVNRSIPDSCLGQRISGMPTPPARRAALYCYGPDGAARRAILEALATGHAWHILATHHDTTAARPELKRLQAAVMGHKLDVLMLHDLGELGNGVLEVVETAAWIEAEGVDIFCINPPFDTGTAAGRKQMELVRYLASYHGDKRRERQRSSRKPPGGARKKQPPR
jgi:hypothetical protein